MMTAIENIELDQGVDHKGNTFGYDHGRNNFITWELRAGKIAVAKVEHDDQEETHGSLAATRRNAVTIANRQNRLPNSPLRKAILRGFQRD